MHLGRFHAVIDYLERHFRAAKLNEQLEAAASALDQYTQSRAESHITEFRTKLASALNDSDDVAPELLQPYAQQVIEELSLQELFPPLLRKSVNELSQANGFDSAALSVALKKQAKHYLNKISLLKQLDASLRVIVRRVHVCRRRNGRSRTAPSARNRRGDPSRTF